MQITPTLAAVESPNDLLIASPGYSSSLINTLLGPISFPYSSLLFINRYLYLPWYAFTFPPFKWILKFSSSSEGLWSLVSWTASQPKISKE